MLQPGPDRVRCVSQRCPWTSRFVDPKATAPVCQAPHAVPRNAVHTLRSIPLAGSRTASLRPLPSCRCRPPCPDGSRRDAASSTWFVTPSTRTASEEPARDRGAVVQVGRPEARPEPARVASRRRSPRARPAVASQARNEVCASGCPVTHPLRRCLSTSAHPEVRPARVRPCRQRRTSPLTGPEVRAVHASADRLQGVAPPTSP